MTEATWSEKSMPLIVVTQSLRMNLPIALLAFYVGQLARIFWVRVAFWHRRFGGNQIPGCDQRERNVLRQGDRLTGQVAVDAVISNDYVGTVCARRSCPMLGIRFCEYLGLRWCFAWTHLDHQLTLTRDTVAPAA